MRGRPRKKRKDQSVPEVLYDLTPQEKKDLEFRKFLRVQRLKVQAAQRRDTAYRLAHSTAEPILVKKPNRSDSLKGVSCAATQEEG